MPKGQRLNVFPEWPTPTASLQVIRRGASAQQIDLKVCRRRDLNTIYCAQSSSDLVCCAVAEVSANIYGLKSTCTFRQDRRNSAPRLLQSVVCSRTTDQNLELWRNQERHY